jgi:hypothetical protein
MVKIILSTLFFVVAPFLLNAQTPSNIVGVPIKLETIEITQFEFPKEMSYAEAKAACAKLGNGWRLPNTDELNEILWYNEKVKKFTDIHIVFGEFIPEGETKKQGIGMIIDYDYYDSDGNFRYPNDDNDQFYIRPVRTLKK